MALVWSEERANAWQERRGWRVGCNFVPSTASNQLEMWQAPTFDLQTLERELDLARGDGRIVARGSASRGRLPAHGLGQDPQGRSAGAAPGGA